MTAVESLKKRAGVLGAGLVSFVVILGVMRAWSGDPLVQWPGDIGLPIGLVLVAIYFVVTDAKASASGPRKDRASELN